VLVLSLPLPLQEPLVPLQLPLLLQVWLHQLAWSRQQQLLPRRVLR
jgi:hypothetical protein